MRYICFEGVEGSYKTTNTKRLTDYLIERGYNVLRTKEPGTPLNPLTMKLREIMLSNEYASDMTELSREFISQAIRSIHLEKVIWQCDGAYDFIIQDRGTLSGIAYATEIGHEVDFILGLTKKVTEADTWNIYSDVVLMVNDPTKGLSLAEQKQEYAGGDAMESMGDQFMKNVLGRMQTLTEYEENVHRVYVDDRTEDEVFNDILTSLGLNA
jgi:dTMP kinase